MSFKYTYSCDHDRKELGSYLIEIKEKNGTIIDIGGFMKSAFTESNFDIENLRTAIVDLKPVNTNKINFVGNISFYKIWDEILNYVSIHGKFDFCYASHILEDISNPKLVCNMLSHIAKEGFIATPSKYYEAKRHRENLYRGFIHHRWIFNIENEKFVGYPKQNFIEYLDEFDSLAKQLRYENQELQIHWKNSINMDIINDDFLGPTVENVINYYKKIL